MDYEEKTINGVRKIAWNGWWYPLPDEGMVSEFSRPMSYPEPPYDEAMALFPFYDLTNYDLQDLFDESWGEWPCPMPKRCPDWLAEDWLKFNP